MLRTILRLSGMMIIIGLMIMSLVFSYGCKCGADKTTPEASTEPSAMSPTTAFPTTTKPTTTSPMTTSPPSPIGAMIPSLIIVSPEAGQTISSDEVTVEVQVSSFKLADKIGHANAPREGHLHFFLDVDAPTNAYEPAETEEGTYVVSIDPSYTWSDLETGMHKLSVELVNNDSSPVIPLVIAEITIYVQ